MEQETTTDPRSHEAFDRQYRLREAVALFDTEDALESAILALQENGVDRARISVLGGMADSDGKSPRWLRHLMETGEAPHAAPVNRGDLHGAEAAVIALPGFGGVMTGLIAVMATGGALGLAVVAAILAGAAGSGAGYLVARSIGRHHVEDVQRQLAAGGLVLWVGLAEGEDEALSALLEKSGGERVHVTDHTAHWGSADVPFAQAQPDPLL